MNAEDEEWIQYALMEAERRRCISKVLKVDCKDAVPKGNNYVSDIYRLTIKVINYSGEIQERSAIYKIIPVTDNKLKNVKEMGVFKAEAKMYTETLKLMSELQESKEPGSEPLWARFYGVKGNYDGYLMEDLSVHGYVMANRMLGLDFEQVSLCLKNLAKFHALSSVLIEKGSIAKNDYLKNHFFFQDQMRANDGHGKMYALFADVIQEYWPVEWHDYVERLKKLHETMVPKVLEIMQNEENIFLTLNHGDFWLNNILFKYNLLGSPVAVRFVDYQLCHINSPCYDIQYMFSTSLRLELFDRKLELLKVYQESLEENLKLFEYGKPIPSLDDLEADLERTRYFGYCISLLARPTIMNPPLAVSMQFNDEEKWRLIYGYDGDNYLRIMRHILVEMREHKLL